MSLHEHNLNSVFDKILLPGEKILWSWQPDSSIRFSKHDWYLIPMYIVMFGMVNWWIWSVLFALESIAVLIIGGPFVILSVYALIGRFPYKIWRKKHTYYAVTDQRLIVVYHDEVQSARLSELPRIDKERLSDWIWTLSFGNLSFASGPRGSKHINNIGMDIFAKSLIGFYDIHDVDAVYDLICNLKKEKDKESK